LAKVAKLKKIEQREKIQKSRKGEWIQGKSIGRGV